MRLVLAEVPQCLGCSPEEVVWEHAKGLAACSLDENEVAQMLFPSLTEEADGEQTLFPTAFEGLAWGQAPWAHLYPQGAEADSREIKPGQLFFCLPGERVDGHDFALQAAQAGAIGIIAVRNPFWNCEESCSIPTDIPLPPVFIVPDTVRALWRLAICHRDTSLAQVVSITGTAGKTSVKEALAQVLAVRGATAKNHMNKNNQIGLPMSMLTASANASFWVLEAGISKPDDMRELGAIVRPDIALVLNVGEGHTEGLGGKGVAYYKAQLFDDVQPGGTVLANADYPALRKEVEARDAQFAQRNVHVLYFSTKNKDAYCYAHYMGAAADRDNGLFSVRLGGKEYEMQAPFRGTYGAENVAAIVAVAWNLGLRIEEIRQGLAAATLPLQRFSTRHLGNFVIIDDSYNANPLSSARMLEAAHEQAREMKLPLYIVFGEMLELGAEAARAHEELGVQMAEATPEVIFWKGGHADALRRGLARGGYSGHFYPVGGGQEFSALLEELTLTKGIVLFKGSRSNFIERLVENFIDCVRQSEDAHAV